MGAAPGGSCALICRGTPGVYHRVTHVLRNVRYHQWAADSSTPWRRGGNFIKRLISGQSAKPIRLWMEVVDRYLYNPNIMRDECTTVVVATRRWAKVLAAKAPLPILSLRGMPANRPQP